MVPYGRSFGIHRGTKKTLPQKRLFERLLQEHQSCSVSFQSWLTFQHKHFQTLSQNHIFHYRSSCGTKPLMMIVLARITAGKVSNNHPCIFVLSSYAKRYTAHPRDKESGVRPKRQLSDTTREMEISASPAFNGHYSQQCAPFITQVTTLARLFPCEHTLSICQRCMSIAHFCVFFALLRCTRRFVMLQQARKCIYV